MARVDLLAPSDAVVPDDRDPGRELLGDDAEDGLRAVARDVENTAVGGLVQNRQVDLEVNEEALEEVE